MPIYDFIRDITTTPKTGFPNPGIEPKPNFHIQTAVKQLSDVEQGRVDILGDSIGKHPDYEEEFLMPGFRSLDEAMKNYWSGIKIPTKDAYRYMAVKIAGGDKSLMAWSQSFADGRIILPVCSINRTSHEFNPDKFSPPYLSMARKYTSSRRDRVVKVKRPVPFNVEYELVIWAEHKRDAEYALYQISTRFNPLAQFRMQDEHLVGWVTLKPGGHSDSSDKEISHDQKAKVRYEFKMTAEAWLPISETVVPTVLGHSALVKEKLGGVLMSIVGDKIVK